MTADSSSRDTAHGSRRRTSVSRPHSPSRRRRRGESYGPASCHRLPSVPGPNPPPSCGGRVCRVSPVVRGPGEPPLSAPVPPLNTTHVITSFATKGCTHVHDHTRPRPNTPATTHTRDHTRPRPHTPATTHTRDHTCPLAPGYSRFVVITLLFLFLTFEV